MSLRLFSFFIKKTKRPICVECAHYIEYKHDYPYYELYDKSRTGSCYKFGSQNLVTGDIEYEGALECRKNSFKCDETGVYYKAKNKSLK